MQKKAGQATERHRQPRTPVNINALLIGEKTVPKGCRVINVSQYGMLLYCEADGRLATFNDGDTVDIHLTVQHAGKQKKLTIPAYVRHVAENSVDVEFHHPDPILMDLIESYRVSEQHKLEATLGTNHTETDKITHIGTTRQQSAPAVQPAMASSQGSRQKTAYLGSLALMFTLCVATGGYVYTSSVDTRLQSLETVTGDHSDALKDLENRVFSTSLQEGRYASLNARITALGDAFSHLEDRVSMLFPASDSSSATGAGEIAANEAGVAKTGDISRLESPNQSVTAPKTPEPVQVATPVTAAVPEQGAVAAEEPATIAAPVADTPADPLATTDTSNAAIPEIAPTIERQAAATPETVTTTQDITGPWTINLVSSPQQTDITRLQASAEQAGIDTTIEQTQIKGRTYWRLQIRGYDSFAEAEAAAAPVKEALKLGDVWIFKRK